MPSQLTAFLYLFTLFAYVYSVPGRWGQAATVLNDALIVHGGKTDEYHQYSYASAPSTSDILYLPLSSAFTGASPPWQLLNASHGPTLSWHTISPMNTTHLLVFGGDPGPNSPQVLPGLADSVALLNLGSHSSPTWTLEPQGWGNQPARRFYHTSSYANQRIYIIGGARADGSGIALYDHYVFDISKLSFTTLPTPGGPEDLVGHVSLVTSNGLLLVFGGFSPSGSTLVPLSLIWTIDTTQPNPTWTALHTLSGDVPSGRRAFAAAVTRSGKVVIHGGTDAIMQNTMSDGWMLDLNTRMWKKMDILTDMLGSRREHFAAAVGETILFGFGYGANGPAPAPLAIVDMSNGQPVPTFSPPTSQLPPTSLASGTRTPSPTQPGRTSLRPSGTTRASSTASSSSTGGGGGGRTVNDNAAKNDTTAIAVGSSLAILAVLAAAFIASYYVRRRRRREGQAGLRKFHPLGDPQFSSADDDKDIPIVGAIDYTQSSWLQRKNTQILNALGMRRSRNAGRGTIRRNLLADEDTAQYDPYGAPHRRDWTTGSSWSLFSMLGGANGAGRGRMSREGSLYGAQISLVAREKEGTPGDNQGAPLMDYADEGPNDGSRRQAMPSGSSGTGLGYWYQQPSYTSEAYVDPFEDPPPQESVIDLTAFSESEFQDVPPILPPKPSLSRRLSPLLEQSSLSNPSSSSSTQTTFPPSIHRKSSEEPGGPIQSSRSSAVGGQPNESIRRSDSWWSRLSRSAFQDRRTIEPNRHGHRIDFRDPNPPPRLSAIRESTYSTSNPTSPDSPQAQRGAANLSHGRSISSLRTADSEAIERIGAMVVVQREGTVDSHLTMPGSGRQSPVSDVASPLTERTVGLPWADDNKMDMDSSSQSSVPSSMTASVPPYVSQEQEAAVTSLPTQHYEELPTVKPRQSVKYGLMPRPSLFVANPDSSQSRSTDS